MDGLSGAASVMAAVSLTFQLVYAVNDLREFWVGLQNAPAEVKDIVDDLALLSSILGGVDRAYALHDDPNDHNPEHAKSIYMALLRCQLHVEKMKVFADNLQNDFAKRRYRTAFKTILQRPKIAEFAKHLEHAKSTLLMAINVTTLLLQNECGRAVQEQFSALRSDMMDFATDIACSASQLSPDSPNFLSTPPPPYREEKQQRRSSQILCSKSSRIAASDILLWLIKLPPESPYRKSLAEYGRLVGRIAWQSSSRLVAEREGDDQALEDSMIISIELPIIRRSFSMRSQKNLGQWTHSFRVSRIIPDDAPIFKLCATKDTATVRKLFDSRMASPFDQTASGVTLLHAAAAGYRCQTYKLLCDAGVEYGLCEESLYGKLGPIALTQNFTVFTEGRWQTVQEWLKIDEDEHSVFHPERHYDSVTRIWNYSLEIQDEISDAEIMTMLQGPLRIPRGSEKRLDPVQQVLCANQNMAQYGTSLLLFCYYFMFHQDPYGRRITKATMSSPMLKGERPLYECVGEYWDAKEWIRLLSKCANIDFHKLAQRQQDKHPFQSRRRNEADGGASGKIKIARISSSDETYFDFCIGPLKDWNAVFEFEGECEDIESPADSPADFVQQVVECPCPGSKSFSTGHSHAVFRIINDANRSAWRVWLYWTITWVGLQYFLYYISLGRLKFSN